MRDLIDIAVLARTLRSDYRRQRENRESPRRSNRERKLLGEEVTKMTKRLLDETRTNWSHLGLYQRFEQVVVLVLGILISVVIVVAMFNLLRSLWALLQQGVLDPARPEVFQSLFGMIMIVLIALEFNHTILGILERGLSVVQVRAVVLIALMAVLRKFIVIEVAEADAMLLFALSAATLALGGIYWAVREQDTRSDDG
jgi:uncharacterized membrane protein (DUF373 family)